MTNTRSLYKFDAKPLMALTVGVTALLVHVLNIASVSAKSVSEVDESGSSSSSSRLWSVFSGFLVILSVGLLVLVGAVMRERISAPTAPIGTKVPPKYTTGFPVFGNFVGFAKSPVDFIMKAKQEIGGIFTLDLLVEQCTILTGHQYHQVFFEGSDEDLEQAPVYKFMTPIFGKNVIYDASLGERRQQMRALGSCLKPSQLKKYTKIIAKEAREYFLKKWGQEGQVDLLPSMAELIILTASATLLGPEVRNELFLEVSELYEMLDKGLTPLSVFFPYAPISAHSRRDKARKEMGELFSRVIKKRKEKQEVDEDDRRNKIDMLQKLMEFEYKDGRTLTDDEITGLLVAALFAGQHTSSITTTWSTLFLLNDKKSNGGKYFEKVMEELGQLEQANSTPGGFSRGEDLSSSVVQEEVKLYNAVKESIRMFPPLIMLMRRVQTPITTSDGYYIPKGNRLIVSNAVAQRLPEVFEEPDKWKPERWNDFDMAKLPKYSFIGFGAGIHTCMGESFAFLQIRTILSVMFSMYDLELVNDLPPANYEAIVVPPKGPNMIKYKMRTKKDGNTLSSKYYVSNPEEIAKLKKVAKTKTTEEFDPDVAEFSLEEIAKHNKKDDAWLVVKGKVYDVTNYVHLHQGGDAAILNYAGKPDATEAVYGPQHPKTVPTLLERFLVGKVKSS